VGISLTHKRPLYLSAYKIDIDIWNDDARRQDYRIKYSEVDLEIGLTYQL